MPLPLELHVMASSSRSCKNESERAFLREGVRRLQFPPDSKEESKESPDGWFLRATGPLGILRCF
jgi:hypothetical protein